MFPFAFEWVNDASHFVFMIPFYLVLITLFVILNICGIVAIFKWLCKPQNGLTQDVAGHGEHH